MNAVEDAPLSVSIIKLIVTSFVYWLNVKKSHFMYWKGNLLMPVVPVVQKLGAVP